MAQLLRGHVRGSGEQRVQRQHLLVGQSQPVPAGGDDPHLRAGAQQRPGQLARVGEDVLAVVDHEQLRARAQVLADRSARCAVADIHAEGGGDGAVDAACRHGAQFGHRGRQLEMNGEVA